MDNLKEHLRSHISNKQPTKDFLCPYCPKAFAGSSLLNIHIRTHTGKLTEKEFLISKIFKNLKISLHYFALQVNVLSFVTFAKMVFHRMGH